MIGITGGSGFLGKNLIESIQNDIISIDLKNTEVSKKINQIIVDISNQDEVKKLKNFNIDVIIHTAAIISSTISKKDPLRTFKTNVIGTINMLEYARKMDVNKFIYISTGGIYKNSNKDELVTEDWPKDPKGFYSLSKFTAENVVKEYSKEYDIPSIAFRITAPYGPWMSFDIDALNRHTFLFAFKCLQKKNIIMPYGGDHSINYTYIGDIVEAIKKTLSFSFKGFDVFNITSGKNYTIKELGEVCKKIEPIINVNIGDGDLINSKNFEDPLLKPLPIKQGKFDISKAEKILNFKPKYTLEEGLKNLIYYIRRENINEII